MNFHLSSFNYYLENFLSLHKTDVSHRIISLGINNPPQSVETDKWNGDILYLIIMRYYNMITSRLRNLNREILLINFTIAYRTYQDS